MTDVRRSASRNTAPGDAAAKLRLTQRLGYGAGDMAFLLVWQGSALFLLYFYTDILGLSPYLAGAIFLSAMVWDAISDPLIATWAERRAARSGRYTPIIAWAALPMGVSYAMMFAIPFSAPVLMAIFALVSHLAFRTAYTFASMPYNTLPARLTANSDERSTLSALRLIGAALGGFTAAIATPAIVTSMAAQGEAMGYQTAALFAGGLAALVLFVSSQSVGETLIVQPSPRTSHYWADFKAMWTSARGNTPFLRLLGVMALATIGYGFFTSSLLYFAQHVLQQPGLVTPILGLSALATLLSAPLWSVLATRTSKRTALIIGLGVAALGYLLFGLAPASQMLWILGAAVIAGIGGAAIPVMLWSMLPDTIDHAHARTGTRIEARSFGLMTFVQKTMAGLTVLMAGGLLGLTGYSANSDPSPDALVTIEAMVAWLPAIFMLAIIAVIRLYPIDRDAHIKTLRALDQTRSGSA